MCEISLLISEFFLDYHWMDVSAQLFVIAFLEIVLIQHTVTNRLSCFFIYVCWYMMIFSCGNP